MSSTNSSSVPFAWVDKRMVRRIREKCEDYGTALAVYLALALVESDKGGGAFQTTHSWLASFSGFCARTVKSRLKDLEGIGAIAITTPKLKAPSTYRLLPFGNDGRTIGNGCPTIGNGCRTIGNGIRKPLPTSEEKKYNNSSKASKAEITPDWLSELAGDLAYQAIPLDAELSKARRWCKEKSRQCTRQFFIGWLNRCRPQSAPAGTAAVQSMTPEDIVQAAL
jgi:hypothetical protein